VTALGFDPVELLRRRFPDLAFESVTVVDDGWDSVVCDVDDEWIVRIPRRPDVSRWIERELRLLPELAPRLPIAVPAIERVARNDIVCVAYRKLPGQPAGPNLGREAGVDLGRFLTALHRFPVERARVLGVPLLSREEWREAYGRRVAQFARRVVPLLDRDERPRAKRLLAEQRALADFEPALVHRDLGPEHVLCRDGRVEAVIDWSDACVGDPAIDLAWCLHGTPGDAAAAVAATYGSEGEIASRALWYHRLGPWYEVTYGLELGDARFVASGLAGVRARLPSR
jgi:aminoglycoside phosphotransferase (APT) family kinase protein